jgi:hypothetical protein
MQTILKWDWLLLVELVLLVVIYAIY